MMVSREDTDAMLQPLTQNATNEIALAVQDVASEFITSGGYGSLRMHITSNERIVKTFLSAARLMATLARDYAGGKGLVVSDLVEAHLSNLLDRTMEERTKHISAGKVAFQDAAILCADLKRDLKRMRDTTVRDLRNLPSDMLIGVTMRLRSKGIS